MEDSLDQGVLEGETVNQTFFVPGEEKIVLLYNNSSFLVEKINKLQKLKKSDIIKRCMRHVYKHESTKTVILMFQVLRCNTRILFYLRKKNSRYENFKKFSYFMIVDLEGRSPGKAFGLAIGHLHDFNIAFDFDGSRVFSIIKVEEEYKLNCSNVSLFGEDKTFSIRNQYFDLKEASSFQNIPSALCFVSSNNMLFLASREGVMYAYYVDFINFYRPKHKTLEHVFKFESLREKENKSFFREMITSYDQKFLIARTSDSRIFILKITKKFVEIVNHIKVKEKIFSMTLSANGRYLAICGRSFRSIRRFDLSLFREESFGANCVNYLSELKNRSTKEGVENAENHESLTDKVICYRFGSKDRYIEFLVDEIKKKKLGDRVLDVEIKTLKLKQQLLSSIQKMFLI